MPSRGFGWVRFDGPGKLHARRWHMAKPSPLDQPVTYCGRFIGRTSVFEVRGPGPVCENCRRAVRPPYGGYL